MSTVAQRHFITPEQESQLRSHIQFGKSAIHKKNPDALASIGARTLKGLQDTSPAILWDIMTRPSTGDEPVLSVADLYREFRGQEWDEPMTYHQAQWRVQKNKERAALDTIIANREKGMLSTSIGVLSQFVSGAALSPETYTPLVVGRLMTATAARATRLLAAGRAAPISTRVTEIGAKVIPRNSFAAGVVEDAVLASVPYTFAYHHREDLLNNPASAMNYFTDILSSAMLAGTLTSTVGRIWDPRSLKDVLEAHASDFAVLASARGDMSQISALREARVLALAIMEPVNEWVDTRNFDGKVKLIDDPDEPTISYFNKDANEIILNTPHLKSQLDVKNQLDLARAGIHEKVKLRPDQVQDLDKAIDDGIQEWVVKTKFTGKIREFTDADDPTVSKFDKERNEIILNRAHLTRKSDVAARLNLAKSGVHSKAPSTLKSDVEVGKDGVTVGPTFTELFRGPGDLSTLGVSAGPKDHVRFNPSNYTNDFVMRQGERFDRMIEELPDTPEASAVTQVESFFEDSDYSLIFPDGDSFPSSLVDQRNLVEKKFKEEQAARTAAGEPESFKVPFKGTGEHHSMAQAIDDAVEMEVTKALRAEKLVAAFSEHRDKYRRFDQVAEDMEDTLGLEFLRAAGITEHDVLKSGSFRVSIEDAVIRRFIRKRVMLRVHREIVQNEANDTARGWGVRKGVRARITAFLDGTIKGKNFTKGGDNLNTRMHVLVNEMSSYIDASFTRNGVSKFLNTYDDEAADFFTEIDRALDGAIDVSKEAADVAKSIAKVNELLRRRLNAQGAGIEKLDGYFFRQIHNRDRILKNQWEWARDLMKHENVDWARMGYAGASDQDRLDFIRAVEEDIAAGHHVTEVGLDPEVHGGKKAQQFAHSRVIHFQPGKGVWYNDKWGHQDTAKELMNQVALRSKAVVLTELAGPDFKAFWRSLEDVLEMNPETSGKQGLSESDADDIVPTSFISDIQLIRNHWDQLTGEASIPESKPLALWGATFRNYVKAMTLHGTGITTLFSDPVNQIINLRSSGMSNSIMGATMEVIRSYGPAIDHMLGLNSNQAIAFADEMLLPHDTNLAAARAALGDSSAALNEGLSNKIFQASDRLSQATIKWSGAGIFTKLSQLTSIIGSQRQLAYLLKNSGERSPDFEQYLKRHKISMAEFDSLTPYIIDDQLSVFDIPDDDLRRRFQNVLNEGMRTGSLTADPYQTALVHWGTKAGTAKGEFSRGLMMYVAPAVAIQQKLYMRMAVLGGNDAHWTSLFERSRIIETVSVLGMMLGSAAVIMTVKDALKNKEPFFLGDKPFAADHMKRILQVSGVFPLMLETIATAGGGASGAAFSAIGQAYDTLDSFITKDKWQGLHDMMQLSPFIATNFGPMPTILQTMIGAASEEYLRDTIIRQRQIRYMTGQDKIF